MSSIFIGQKGLRHNFSKNAFGAFAGATSAATAILVHRFDQAARMCFLDNNLDADVNLLLVHPDADPAVVTNRLYWIELPMDRVINYDMNASPGLIFDPGTLIMAYSSTPTAGKLRIASWG